MEAHDWIAICAHQLQRHWRTVAPEQLEEVAYELWRDSRLRALPPRDAASDFLRPLTGAPSSHAELTGSAAATGSAASNPSTAPSTAGVPAIPATFAAPLATVASKALAAPAALAPSVASADQANQAAASRRAA